MKNNGYVKCKMTMSGGHIWVDNYVPAKFFQTKEVGMSIQDISIKGQYKKCMACGMVDDRKKAEEQMKEEE